MLRLPTTPGDKIPEPFIIPPGRLSLSVVLLVSISLLTGCFEKPLSPVAPVWDVQVNVPLMNRSYTVDQILRRDPSLFHSDASGLLVYSNTQQFAPIAIDDHLKIDPVSGSYQTTIGKFSVKGPSSKVKQFSAVELNPAFGDQGGEGVILPSYNFALSNQTFATLTELREAALTNGQATVTVTNRVQLPIDNISLTVQSQYGQLLRFDHAAAVQPDDSVESTFPLADLVIGDALSLSFSGRFPQSAVPVKVDPSSSVVVRLDFPSEIEAARAVAQLPANTFMASGSFLADDSTRIDLAEIKSGSITLTLNNPLGIPGQATFTIPDIRRPNGEPFTQVVSSLLGQHTVTATFPLEGYSVRSPDGELAYAVTTQTFDTGNNLVTIDSSMTISGSVTSSAIHFKNFQGTIKPTSVAVSVSRAIDLNRIDDIFTGTTKFSQASLYLNLTPPGNFSADLNTTILARNSETGQSSSLTIPLDQRRVSSSRATITLTEANSNIVSFLNSFSNKLPNEFTLTGDFILNPTYSSGSVTVADSLGVQMSLDIPLKVGILNGVARDTSAVNISSEARKEIDQTNYGKVYFEIQNGLPTSIQIGVDFLDNQRNKLITLPKPLQPAVVVAGAEVDGQGRAVLPASSTSFIELMSDDVEKVQAAQFLSFSMNIQTSGGGNTPVQFRTDDAVQVRAYSSLNYRVNVK